MASGGHSSSWCAGLSLSRPLLLRNTGSRRAGSAIVAHGPSCSAACGIFPDQGSNPCPLHWQADSQPLRHLGSPKLCFLICISSCLNFHVQTLMYYLLLSKHCTKSLYLLFTANHEVNNHHHVSEKTEAQRSEVSCPEAAASGCRAVI